jgi:hypothetical protein
MGLVGQLEEEFKPGVFLRAEPVDEKRVRSIKEGGEFVFTPLTDQELAQRPFVTEAIGYPGQFVYVGTGPDARLDEFEVKYGHFFITTQCGVFQLTVFSRE